MRATRATRIRLRDSIGPPAVTFVNNTVTVVVLAVIAGLAIVLLMVVSLLSELFTSVRAIFQLY